MYINFQVARNSLFVSKLADSNILKVSWDGSFLRN